jgi:hypothetical protein
MATFKIYLRRFFCLLWMGIVLLDVSSCGAGPGTGGTGPGPGPGPGPVAIGTGVDERQRVIGYWSTADSSIRMAFEPNRIQVLRGCDLFEFSEWSVLNNIISASQVGGVELAATVIEPNFRIRLTITEQSGTVIQTVISSADLTKDTSPYRLLARPAICP